MAKYKAYPEYKDSGNSNIGVIPSHWELKKLKHLTKCLDGSRIPLNATQRGEMQGVIPYWGANNIVDYVNAYLFDEELILLGEDGAPFFDKNKDVAFHITGKIWPNNHVHVLRPKLNLTNAKFLAYAINCTDFSLHISGSTRDKLNQSDMDNINIRYCDRNEQGKISFFLDHETAKIDNLIEKQQQLIELLKEKRQAVISHAVTKGLNPDVPMKDSGVEWLGDVPEHWIIKRLKHISPKVGVGLVINPSTYTKDEGVYFIFGGDVKEFGFDLTKTRRISPQDSNKLVPSRLNSRDLVSVRVGYPGITSVVTDDLEGSNCASIIIIRRGSYNSDWLCAAMNVWVGRQQVDLASYGAAQKQFNVSDAIEFVFPVPSINEQNYIADFVKKTLNKFDDLTQKALKQIELLQERRTAIISAAVTGKIDVRDWVAPDTQDVEEPQEATV